MSSQYEEEEYLEPNEEELEAAARRRKLIVLGIMAALVIAGVVLVNKLRVVSQLQDCLMTRATNCNDLVEPPKPVGVR
ncbi:MAG: hypothetical protein JOY64_16975 [Alphaproteobacteria bacterium]|nr:hypothetical protein [Alphaproteobacteria bacterium]MBV8409327.1 hypothetical protein [Alphaproteobacteria bacterium]